MIYMKMSKERIGRCYLVDSENVRDTWIDLLDIMREKDRLLVFYTVNSSHIRCEQVEKIMQKNDGRMLWISCFEGNNALDFQLVTCLGAMVAEEKAGEYVIISKDTGFDAVVKFWKRDGVCVRRSRGASEERRYLETHRETADSEEKKDSDADKGFLENKDDIEREGPSEEITKGESEWTVQPGEGGFGWKAGKPYPEVEMILEPETQAVLEEEIPEEAELEDEPDVAEIYAQKVLASEHEKKSGKHSDKKHGKKSRKDKREKIMSRMARSLDIRDMSLFHNALVAFFGAEEGDRYYGLLKEQGEGRKKYEKLYLKDRHQRALNYVELILEMDKLDTEDAPELYRILAKDPKRDLQKLYSQINRKYDGKKATEYYRLLRRHINILKKL